MNEKLYKLELPLRELRVLESLVYDRYHLGISKREELFLALRSAEDKKKVENEIIKTIVNVLKDEGLLDEIRGAIDNGGDKHDEQQ